MTLIEIGMHQIECDPGHIWEADARIGYFRGPFCLYFKASLRGKSLL